MLPLAFVRYLTATGVIVIALAAMVYFLQMRSSDGRVVKDGEPYADLAEVLRDAKFGARQIVGDAIKGGTSLRSSTSGRTFEIVDETGTVVASLPFLDLIGLEGES